MDKCLSHQPISHSKKHFNYYWLRWKYPLLLHERPTDSHTIQLVLIVTMIGTSFIMLVLVRSFVVVLNSFIGALLYLPLNLPILSVGLMKFFVVVNIYSMEPSPQTRSRTFPSLQKSLLMSLGSQFLFSNSWPPAITDLHSLSIVLPFLEFHVNGLCIMQCFMSVFFCLAEYFCGSSMWLRVSISSPFPCMAKQGSDTIFFYTFTN